MKGARQIIVECQTFEGDGVFPVDMLRCDQCWPATERDAGIMNVGPQTLKRQVRLMKYRLPGQPSGFTNERWLSFQWKPVEGSFTWSVY